MLLTRTLRWFRSLGFVGHIHNSLLQGVILRAFAELRVLASSARPHGTARFPINGFS